MLAADNAVDAYRMGKLKEAGRLLSQQKDKNDYENYYLGEMRLYGYGLEKNNALAMQAYQMAAQKGFLPALQIMARYHLLIDKNPSQALYWFKQAALQKDMDAIMYCGAAYQFGYGTSVSLDIARKYFIQAAQAGQAKAQFYLAQYFLDEKKGADKKLGLIWLDKAIKQAEPDALVYQARQLYQQKEHAKAKALLAPVLAKNAPQALTLKAQWLFEENDWIRGHQYLLKAAQKAYAPAQFELGQFYLKKETPFYQPDYGFLWILQALKNQSPEAKPALEKMNLTPAQEQQFKTMLSQIKSPQSQYQTLSMYLSSNQATTLENSVYRMRGIWRDWKNQDALREQHFNAYPQFFQLSTQELFKPVFNPVLPSSIPFYEYLDALTLLKGPVPSYRGSLPSYVHALQKEWSAKEMSILKRQANLGVSSAQLQLGACYEFAWGLKKDLSKAKKWYQKAMQQDELRAEYQLGILELTRGDAQVIEIGKSYLRDAAFKGDLNSQITLGLLNEIPRSKNLAEAKNMLMLAAANGNGLGMYRLAEWVSREPTQKMNTAEREAHYHLLRQLYRGAFKAGIQEAALPLAFYEASSKKPQNQIWAMKTALSYASRGHLEAAILLGLMIDRDEHHPNHRHQAKQWFKKAQNHPIGAFIWSFYENDLEEKQVLLEKAASAHFPYAYINLAALKLSMRESPLEDLTKAAQLNHSLARHLLANFWVLESDVNLQKRAREIFEEMASKGDEEAQWKYAYLLAYGIGGEQKGAKALEWLKKSAAHSAVAQFVLAYLYHMGQFDGRSNDKLAQYWFTKAATQLPKASIALGYLKEMIDKNYHEALQAYEKVRDEERVLANYNIALMYEYGKGVEPNFFKAKRYFIAAANGGSAAAMFKLAGYYQDLGYQMTADLYLEKAAALGHPQAIAALDGDLSL